MPNLPAASTMKTLVCLGTAALLALPLTAAAQQHVYRCPGPDGRTVFTDKPCPAGDRMRVNSKGIGTNVRSEAPLRAAARPARKASAPASAASAAASAASAAPAANTTQPTIVQGVQF